MKRLDNDTKPILTLNVETFNIGDYVTQKAESKASNVGQIISLSLSLSLLSWHSARRVITMTPN